MWEVSSRARSKYQVQVKTLPPINTFFYHTCNLLLAPTCSVLVGFILDCILRGKILVFQSGGL